MSTKSTFLRSKSFDGGKFFTRSTFIDPHFVVGFVRGPSKSGFLVRKTSKKVSMKRHANGGIMNLKI